MNWETCSHKDECINGCKYGKGCYEDDLNNAMGGKPWGECMCGIDENGNVPNSKIKELIKECTTIEREFYDNGLGRGYYEDEVFNKEKFAELIIKDCIDWIDGSPTTEEDTLILSKQFIIANLKQHFGIK